MLKWVVFDVDGTLSNDAHRNHIARTKPTNWDLYHERCVGDVPYEPIVELLRAMRAFHYRIALCTGRPDTYRKVTEDWMDTWGIAYDKLLMRPRDNHVRDFTMKPDLILTAKLYPEDVLFIVEDRTRMVEAWRDLGYTCLQVREGNF